MKFVGTIKGKPYLIDPETFEAEIRAKIAQEIINLPEMKKCHDTCIHDGLEAVIQMLHGKDEWLGYSLKAEI